MKKLIAIAMVFALVAGAAFAVDLGAHAGISANVISATTEKGSDDVGVPVQAGYQWHDASLSGSAQNDEGTFGGWIKITPADSWKAVMGQAWWKPIEQFRFMLNYSDTGFFGADDITCWGFYEGAGDPLGLHGNAWGGGPEPSAAGRSTLMSGFGMSSGEALGWNFNFRQAVYGGFERGGIFTITPISGLEINFGVPFLEDAADAEYVYKKINAQVAYNIDGIGKVAFTYAGYIDDNNTPNKSGTPSDGTANGGRGNVYFPGKLFGYFSLSAVENLGLVIGFGIPFIQTENPDLKPFYMAASLGAKYTMGAFGVKARFLADFGGVTYKEDKYVEGVGFIFEVMPYYAVSDSLSINLSVGLGGRGAASDKDGTIEGTAREAGWHVYPYVTVKGGPGTFYAGLKFSSNNIAVEHDKDNNPYFYFSIPVGLEFSF
jgi:hypothetical protein